MKCDQCGQDVPEGVFCTRCGAHQGTTGELSDPKARLHSYAAHPGEPVVHAGVFTTLFPHLGHSKVSEFRWAFIVGVALIVVLNVLGFNTTAILVAAVLMPALYLMYLREAQVYKDEPVRVLAIVFGGGIVLGVVVTVLTNRLLPGPHPIGATLEFGTVFVVAILIPIIQEIVKPLPALFLRGRPGFGETVDGLVFGITAGLGFTFAATIVSFSPVLAGPFHADPANWIYSLLTLGVLNPILQGSATGAIVAAIWRASLNRLGTREIGVVVAAIVAHVLFSAGQLWISNAGLTPLIALLWEALVVAGLLVYIRFVLHHALLEEASHMGFTETVCPNCHKHIVAAGFCPACGKALTAAPDAVRTTAETPAQAAPAAPTAKPEGA